MYRTRLGEAVSGDGTNSQLVYSEMDPSGRYGRFKEILGKGAMKTVYRAFDELVGMEVAWNQVKLSDVFRSPDELQRLYSEVHLLKNLNHDSIMRFYTTWIAVDGRTFNFITELFTSGTLREYRRRYKRIDIRAIKNWSRQILQGLAHLHGLQPPVIHRDLKCDNIFINGHLGQVKIGDLGLAATLRDSQHAHSVIGTPEFMAPELYEEDYDELADVYSFGMCILEMLTGEYPYSECSNPAQIYKKVTSGKLPQAFYRIQDVGARRFVGQCLETASKRPSANELLLDPFLAPQVLEDEPMLCIPPRIPSHDKPSAPNRTMAVKMPPLLETGSITRNTDMTITGTMNPEDDSIFLKVQISDKNGQARNIYFPFDTASDTALEVATEMVKELEITDWEPFEIAEMIDEEISALVPTWKKERNSSQKYNPQHSFNYNEEDDGDETNHHPFDSLSSHCSSQASLEGLFTSCMTKSNHEKCAITSKQDWSQDEFLINDDASSQNSWNSYKYSSMNYCSAVESDFELSSNISRNYTRFCPDDRTSQSSNKHCHALLNSSERACNYPNQQRKMVRIGSLMDVRSQLLHRSLVEEINKRRLFKTVGAIENIGYHEPAGYSSQMGGGPINGGKQGFEW
ncbi:hypothetical protein RJ639_007275 [Escallonia herrerae]|uniref:non-specific serine/threonine protein kinase n=1 Tax=Escallonia herrerae TaxID=1293975 RepID=A0AA89AU48_9ASTE|nr:hypothetical protein RJ639_007275 [Escallonia herrerae]